MARRRVNAKIRILPRVLIIIMLVISLSSCALLGDGMYYTPEEIEDLTVKMLDVGQGDSILIMTSDKTMLIDAGINGCGSEVVNAELKKYGRTTLDYVIATHPHSDHIGGLDEVISYVDSVGYVYMPELEEDLVPTTFVYTSLLDALMETDAQVASPIPGETITMGEAVITFLGPVEAYDDLNDSSIVIRLDYGEVSFLFTGDCRKGAFNDIINAGYDVDVDVLKAAHHGSSNAINKKIFNAISPELTLISCGIDNSYGHPHDEAMEILDESGTDFYRTDYNGTITVVTNGVTLEVTSERGEKNLAA